MTKHAGKQRYTPSILQTWQGSRNNYRSNQPCAMGWCFRFGLSYLVFVVPIICYYYRRGNHFSRPVWPEYHLYCGFVFKNDPFLGTLFLLSKKVRMILIFYLILDFSKETYPEYPLGSDRVGLNAHKLPKESVIAPSGLPVYVSLG